MDRKSTHEFSKHLNEPMGLTMPDALPCDARIRPGLDVGEVDDVAPTQGMCSSSGHSRIGNLQLFLFTYELEMLSKKSEKKTQSRGRAGAHTEGASRGSAGEGGGVSVLVLPTER